MEFTKEQIKTGSSANAALFTWVNALVEYQKASVKIEPLKKQVEVMNLEYQKVLAELNAKQAVLKQVVDKLQELENKFDEAKKEKAKLDF